MVGLMATWSTTRVSAAFKAAVHVVLLAILVVAATPTWAGATPSQHDVVTGVMPAGAEVSELATPPQPPVRAEHLPRPWPDRHRAETPETPALVWPQSGSAAIRGPQQPGHRAAGSRSPPPA